MGVEKVSEENVQLRRRCDELQGQVESLAVFLDAAVRVPGSCLQGLSQLRSRVSKRFDEVTEMNGKCAKRIENIESGTKALGSKVRRFKQDAYENSRKSAGK